MSEILDGMVLDLNNGDAFMSLYNFLPVDTKKIQTFKPDGSVLSLSGYKSAQIIAYNSLIANFNVFSTDDQSITLDAQNNQLILNKSLSSIQAMPDGLFLIFCLLTAADNNQELLFSGTFAKGGNSLSGNQPAVSGFSSGFSSGFGIGSAGNNQGSNQKGFNSSYSQGFK